MKWTMRLCLFCVLLCWGVYLVSPSPYTWMARDRWDIINEKFSNVTSQNCRSLSKRELMLPADSVAAVPKYNELLSSKTYSNR